MILLKDRWHVWTPGVNWWQMKPFSIGAHPEEKFHSLLNIIDTGNIVNDTVSWLGGWDTGKDGFITCMVPKAYSL